MGIVSPEEEATYLVVVADDIGTPLRPIVDSTLPADRSGFDAIGPWKETLVAELEKAGHSWYSITKIQTRPKPNSSAR